MIKIDSPQNLEKIDNFVVFALEVHPDKKGNYQVPDRFNDQTKLLQNLNEI